MSYKQDAQVINYFLAKYNSTKMPDREITRVLLKEFCNSLRELDEKDQAKLLIENSWSVLKNILGDDFPFSHKEFDKLKELSQLFEPKNQKQFDVIIITVITPELDACMSVFNLTDDEKIKDEITGIRYWEKTIERDNKPPINILLTNIGTPGNIICCLYCMNLFSKFKPGLAILSGIAAGLKSKITKYSTVVSKGIVDYEHQRYNKDGTIRFRPENYNVTDDTLKMDCNELTRNVKRWQEEFDSELKKLLGTQKRYQEFKKNINKMLGLKNTTQKQTRNSNWMFNLKIKQGEIASGAKLFADAKKVMILNDKITLRKGIIAAEMEGSGFCAACNSKNIDWLVFRGISDYGGKDKDQNQNKKYQNVAALSAAVAIKNFLKYEYTDQHS